MIPIIKNNNNNILFEISNKKYIPVSNQLIHQLKPQISTTKQLHYNQWLHKFNHEIDSIINEYIEFLNYITTQKNLVYSLNINEFNSQLKKIIYNNSFNRFKYYQELI
jgi:hypothetical protein